MTLYSCRTDIKLRKLFWVLTQINAKYLERYDFLESHCFGQQEREKGNRIISIDF